MKLLVVFFLSCLFANCTGGNPGGCLEPRSPIPIQFPYQVVSSINDSLDVVYAACQPCWLQGCTLRSVLVQKNKVITSPGTYNISGDSILIGNYINIQGFSKKKGWTLKIVSRSGAVIETSDNKNYTFEVMSNGDTVWSKLIWGVMRE